MPNITEKEAALLNKIAEGMDQPGEGWLHHFAPENKSTSGLVSSLVQKGLITSFEEKEPGMPACFWVAATDKGIEAVKLVENLKVDVLVAMDLSTPEDNDSRTQ